MSILSGAHASCLVHIHWWEVHASYEAYLAYLKNIEINTYAPKTRWHTNICSRLTSKIPVYYPTMPGKYNAQYHEWGIVFENIALKLDEKSILIGHSLGGNFLVKYLSEHSIPVGTLHLVAPCFSHPEGWFDFGEDLSNVSNNTHSIHLWHSTDDTVISSADIEQYKQVFPSIITHEFHDRFHFLDEEFLELEEELLKEITQQ